VLSALDVLELIGLYDDRLKAETLSRLIGAGVWMLPQGMRLPTATNDPNGGGPQDFLRLLMQIGSLAIKDRRSAAALLPVLVEADAQDIEAASKGPVKFWSDFDEHIGDLQDRAIQRWATGIDLPAEVLTGQAQATHWNASLISEDKVQSFVVPSLRRATGNITLGWLRPALAQFGYVGSSLEIWFDATGIKTRIDLGEEAQWAHDRFAVSTRDAKAATGLSQAKEPDGEELKRQMLLHMARQQPAAVPFVLEELGIPVRSEGLKQLGLKPGPDPSPLTPPRPGRQGPQEEQAADTEPRGGAPGRSTRLSTRS
jgi:hypothetical protein